MRWISYFILSYLALGIQLGLGSFASYRGVAPDLLLLVVVFISLNASRDEAMLGSFLLGAMQDLITLQPMGLFAFSYGLVSIFVSISAESVRRTHPLTQIAMTFLGGSLMGMLLIVHDYFRPVSPAFVFGGTVVGALRIGPRVVVVSVIYTTLLSPLVIGLLQLFQRLFAFDSDSRRRDYV